MSDPLEALAKDVWAEHQDMDKATETIIAAAWEEFSENGEDDRPLFDAIVELGAHVAVQRARSACAPSSPAAKPREINAAWKGDTQVAPVNKALPENLLVRWGASVAAGYKFQLPNGQKLGDCTREELTKAAQTFAAFSKETGQKSRWLLLIAQGLPPGRTVRDRFSEARLIELANQAEKADPIPA